MKTNTCFALMLALPAFLVAAGAHCAERSRERTQCLVYVGTYTEKASKGIYAFRFDPATNRLTAPRLAAETTNPTFLAVDPTGRFLYAVNEIPQFEGRSTGAVSAFAIVPGTGKLTFLNEVPSGGSGPCHLTVDSTGKYVVVADYDSGNLAVFPILSDGRLGSSTALVQHRGTSVNPERQEGPHVHSVYMSPDNRFVVSADLGLDQVFVYHFDATKGTLTPNVPPSVGVEAGAGPRHFAFHPNGKFGYAIDEMKSTITEFSYDPANGVLNRLRAISTIPAGFKNENDAAEVAVHPSGKFLYASNRGLDSIAVFSVNPSSGSLRLLAQVPTLGKTPRNFSIDPTGTYLFVANQDSDNVVRFRINANTGLLSPTGQVLQVPSPVCVTFVAIK
jgi:6-phosphogluconolactonase